MTAAMLTRSAMLILGVAAVTTRSHDGCPPGCSCGPARLASRLLANVTADGGGDRTLIDCEGLNLTSIPRPPPQEGDGAGAGAAGVLLASDNRLTHLDLSVLSRFPRLRVFVARNCSIRSLTKSTKEYAPLYELVHADLSVNHLHVIHPYVFSGFPSLKTLNLSHNVIHTMAATAFSLPALQTLDLSRNQIEEVLPHFFDSSPHLSEILLARNRLSRVNDGTFGLLTRLALLDLSRNSLMRLEDNVLVGMTVVHLDLGYNALRKMPCLPLRKLTNATTIVLDGNLFATLPSGALHDVRVKFLSISRNAHLARIDENAIRSMPDLQTLTINGNPRLAYVHSGAITDVPRLAALDLSRNALFALESALPARFPALKALYLSGNSFHCHCGLRWISDSRFPGGAVLQDRDRIMCHPGGQVEQSVPGGGSGVADDSDEEAAVPVVRAVGRFGRECEPYILPLFPLESEQMMGRSVTWLCKAMGSDDVALHWRLPAPSSGGMVVVREGDCDGRVCVDENALTVRYLHPGDSGRYTCVAKNKYGQDQRQVALKVESEHIQIFPITVASTFVTLSWNSSGALSTGRGYILQVSQKSSLSSPKVVPRTRQYEDIDVGLKMNSYTVNGLAPGQAYLFELCLRKERYVIPISSMVLTTKNSGFEVEMGIETDYVSLFSVAIILSSMVTVCFTLSLFRMWQYYYYYHSSPLSPGGHGGGGGRGGASRKDADSLSQREMIVSPSDHSSVAAAIAASNSATKKSKHRISRSVSNGDSAARAACSAMMTSQSASSSSTTTSASAAAAAATPLADDAGDSGLTFAGGTGDEESRLVENEMRSPVDDVVRETVA